MNASPNVTELAAEAELAIQRYEAACKAVRQRADWLTLIRAERVVTAEAALREAEDVRSTARLIAELKLATFKREGGLL